MSATTPKPTELKGGRYVLYRRLGEGSQGETYEAVDHGTAGAGLRRTDRDVPLADQWARYVRDKKTSGGAPSGARLVAIKCFRVGSATSWKGVELAEREARTLSSLDHPKLPRYFEHFEENGALYLVMERIEGESLAAIRARGGSMSAAEVTRMLEDVADALRYLHGRTPPVVHRDIKPGNILRRPDGSFALVDFGAVRDRLKPAGGSTVVGTFGFMAPEQFQGRAFPRSDVYGLGATALTMLTGEDPEALPHEGLGIDVPRALPRGTPAPLARALGRMLVPDPDTRIGSIDEAIALLRVTPPTDERDERRDTRNLSRKERRALEKQRAHERKLAKQSRLAVATVRRAPLVPRMLGRLGLFVAWLVVWILVGLVAPLLLVLFSLLFGAALRRAASACVRAARRSQAALGRASAWLSGHRDEHERAAAPKLRVPEEPRRVRAAVDEEEPSPAEEADEWMAERLQKEAQRERMRLHAREPTRRKRWGR